MHWSADDVTLVPPSARAIRLRADFVKHAREFCIVYNAAESATLRVTIKEKRLLS